MSALDLRDKTIQIQDSILKAAKYYEKKIENQDIELKKFNLVLKNIDLTDNKNISENWWKFLLSSMFMNQGVNLEKIVLRNCELNDDKVRNLVIGTSIGIRRLLDKKNILAKDVIDKLNIKYLDFSSN